jgi:hypothetical protein
MKLRGYVLALAAALSACAPAPASMPASQAAEVLTLFASGGGPANVCSADGRALLRSAVRAYSLEMQRSGVDWPVIPGASAVSQQATQVDSSVMIAFAAGFIRASDFQGAPRVLLNQLGLEHWPELRDMRAAASEACEEVAALQRAAADFVMETARYEQMTDLSNGEWLRRQSARLQRAELRMQEMAALVEVRMDGMRGS